MPTEKFIRCACHSPEHQFILAHWPDEGELYMDIHLVTWENIFRRVWTAIRYVFGHRSQYGHWDCVLISKEKAQEMRELLNVYIGTFENDHTSEP